MKSDIGIRVAIAGLGNCASSLIEGISHYRQEPENDAGLLFPILSGYSVQDINVVAAFDISAAKVGKPVRGAIYQAPNNFVRIPDVKVDTEAMVFRGPTLDGNPEHLARFVTESSERAVNVASVLKDHQVDVLINLLPVCGRGRLRLHQLHPYHTGATNRDSKFVSPAATALVGR